MLKILSNINIKFIKYYVNFKKVFNILVYNMCKRLNNVYSNNLEF